MGIGKKIAIAVGMVAVAVAAVVPAALAGVVNSNHDIVFKMTYSGSAAKGGACSFCHIPHKAGGDKLWASSYASGTGWRTELIAQLCYTCHSIATYNSADVNPFETTNGHHGRTVATLTGFGDIDTLPGSVALDAAGVDLKCTSCHDVHNNDNRPFIRFMGAAGTFNFSAHCLTCHPQRGNTIGQETANIVANASSVNFSQHPTDQTLGNTGDTDEAFGTISTAFSLVVAQGAGTSDWNLGGHRNDGSAGGNMTCATCHAVHGNETSVFTALDGATQLTSPVNGYGALTVLNPDPSTTSAAMCVGCHANDATMGPGTTGITHPIDRATSAWRIGGTALGAGFPTGGPGKWSSDGRLVCQSCHDMHYGQPGTSLLRGNIDAPTATSNKNCNACHAGTTLANHHPSAVPNSTKPTPLTRTTAFNWTNYGLGTAGPAMPLVAGNITCGTCHGGATSKAHNNAAWPGVSSLNAGSDMCVECHSTNPSQYTTTVGIGTGSPTLMQASHYVGEIATVGYKRTVAFGSNAANIPKYAAAGTNGSIICESCHTLKLTNTSSNNTVQAGVVRANVKLLLERNGNLNSVYNTSITGTNADMCTGCHGASPTGGNAGAGTKTHPTISMGMTVAATTAIADKVDLTPGDVSLLAGDLVNCESCHRPHDAAAGSGALILEGAGTNSTKLAGGGTDIFDRATLNGGANYTEEASFCNYCHNI